MQIKKIKVVYTDSMGTDKAYVTKPRHIAKMIIGNMKFLIKHQKGTKITDLVWFEENLNELCENNSIRINEIQSLCDLFCEKNFGDFDIKLEQDKEPTYMESSPIKKEVK